MRRLSLQAAFALLIMGTAASLTTVGCGSSSSGNHETTDSGSSSGGSGSSSGSSGSSSGSSGSSSGSSSGGDGGGCVFETLVTNLVATPPSTAIPCDAALCGCTDNGKLITTVPGSF